MDRANHILHLALVEQHVKEGERHIKQLRKRITRLRQSGHDTTRTRDLLGVLEQTQLLHIAHRDRLRKELAGPPRGSAYTSKFATPRRLL